MKSHRDFARPSALHTLQKRQFLTKPEVYMIVMFQSILFMYVQDNCKVIRINVFHVQTERVFGV